MIIFFLFCQVMNPLLVAKIQTLSKLSEEVHSLFPAKSSEYKIGCILILRNFSLGSGCCFRENTYSG